MIDANDWEGTHHADSTEVDPSWMVAKMAARNLALTSILDDLVKELREGHHKSERFGDCVRCEETWPCERVELAEAAENRLRELGNQ